MSPWTRWGAWAGLAAPLFFIALVIAQMAAKPAHDPVAWPMSALAAGEDGWVQNVNFFVTGTLLVVFAWTLHRTLRVGGTRAWGPALLAASGLGMVWAGAFPLGQAGQPFDPDAGPGLHVVGGVLFFAGSGAALLVLSWRLASDPAWQDRARWARGLGGAVLAIFALMALLVMRPGAPLAGYAGIFQAVAVAIWAAAMVMLARRTRAALSAAGLAKRPASPPA